MRCQHFFLKFSNSGSSCGTLVTQSYRDVLQSSLEVKPTGGGIVVSVSFELHAGISEDRCVISPGRLGEVHVACASMETGLWEKKRLSKKSQLT